MPSAYIFFLNIVYQNVVDKGAIQKRINPTQQELAKQEMKNDKIIPPANKCSRCYELWNREC